METNKIRIMLLMLISLFSALFFYIVIFYGNEKIEKPKNTLASANSELNNEKIEVNTKSQILFETKDYIVYGKIKRNKQVFTQGLFFDTDDTMIESGGLYGQSVLQKFKLDTPDQKIFKIPLESKYFAEGACLLNNRVYQLTWKERVIFVYDYDKLNSNQIDALVKTIPLPTQIEEGWGITNNSSELIISDGTEKLFFVDPLDPEFKVKRIIQVRQSKDNKIYTNLNELEYAYDYIFANIWFSNSILVIDPNTGEVIRKVDLSALTSFEDYMKENKNIDVLNGIAYDKKNDE